MKDERPVECSHCKRCIKVIYKEIVGDSIISSEMCAECPVLQHKLHGEASPSQTGIPETKTESATGLCCGVCRTTLESVQMGNPLGCKECYAVFGDLLAAELSAVDKIPARAKKWLDSKKMSPLHLGKTPTLPAAVAPSGQLTALNEALNEALRKENYEEAAKLRDQIKALMNKKP